MASVRRRAALLALIAPTGFAGQHTAPPAGHRPAALWALPRQCRHAIAVDATRSRLYLLEHHRDGPTAHWRIQAEHAVSLGRDGVDKRREGDARTPLGLYHLTSRLDGPALDPFYGPVALTLDYPNALDRRQGRGGSNIWLHGTPAALDRRPPRDTDGCVVLSNPDIALLSARVALRATPVLIARDLHWQPATAPAPDEAEFRRVFGQWQQARRGGQAPALARFYERGVEPPPPRRGLQQKDLALIAWPDGQPVVQASFAEIPQGRLTGVTRRQHWRLEQGQWRVFDERLV